METQEGALGWHSVGLAALIRPGFCRPAFVPSLMASFGPGRVSLARRIARWPRPALRAAAGKRADKREVCIESVFFYYT